MVKMHNIEQYLKDGITDNVEDQIEVKITNETKNSFDTEFVELSSGDVSRYRVTIEHLD